MCAIIGAMFPNLKTDNDVLVANIRLNTLLIKSQERGRDGMGYIVSTEDGITCEKIIGCNLTKDEPLELIPYGTRGAVRFISNLRAEPTTEYVEQKSKEDQQPYTVRQWSIVHNGTIANDKELREPFAEISKQFHHPLPVQTKIDSASIVETLYMTDKDWIAPYSFRETISRLKGSYAIIALNHRSKEDLFLACNYRPIWAIRDKIGVYFASSESYFTVDGNSFNRPFLLDSYSTYHVKCVGEDILIDTFPLLDGGNKKALSVCSGGMDSVVATAKMIADGYDVTLIHFLYGSRAEGPEVEAVKKIAKRLDCELVLFNLPIYDKSDSPLLQHDSKVAGGEEGAEFAHEWVPARNLVLLSVATAYAEAKGFSKIVLGNNLEEAGAYPDNEPEFINRLNRTLKYAVGDGKQVDIVMPVGNLMKHEIVKLGLELNAPLDLTWSCYKSGELHCGKCGPCFMRKTAFEINNTTEVIKYEV